jgi:hypothetical protein
MAEIIDLVARGAVPAPAGPRNSSCACRSNATTGVLTEADMWHDLSESKAIKNRAAAVNTLAAIIRNSPCPLAAARRVRLYLETGSLGGGSNDQGRGHGY